MLSKGKKGKRASIRCIHSVQMRPLHTRLRRYFLFLSCGSVQGAGSVKRWCEQVRTWTRNVSREREREETPESKFHEGRMNGERRREEDALQQISWGFTALDDGTMMCTIQEFYRTRDIASSSHLPLHSPRSSSQSHWRCDEEGTQKASTAGPAVTLKLWVRPTGEEKERCGYRFNMVCLSMSVCLCVVEGPVY